MTFHYFAEDISTVMFFRNTGIPELFLHQKKTPPTGISADQGGVIAAPIPVLNIRTLTHNLPTKNNYEG
jgi:hypothetical protein